MTSNAMVFKNACKVKIVISKINDKSAVLDMPTSESKYLWFSFNIKKKHKIFVLLKINVIK